MESDTIVKEAKRLETIERNLIEKFRRAEKQDRFKDIKPISDTIVEPVSNDVQKPKKPKPLTPSAARRLEQMEKRLRSDFTNIASTELETIRENERKYEPITRVIKEQNEIVKEQAELRKQNRSKQLMKFRPRVNSMPSREGDQVDSASDNRSEQLAKFRPRVYSTPSNEGDQVFDTANESMKELVDAKLITLGSLGTRYLPRANDNKFGIWYDEPNEHLKIGSEDITFDFDDVILTKPNLRYKGTEGLWKLLTKNGVLVKDVDYTNDDLIAYQDILIKTNSLYQRNDPNTGRPKSSTGQKWKSLIRPIWDHVSNHRDEGTEGSGLKLYNESPIEYKYINNLNQLIGRLNYIYAQESAGNNNFHNEKLSIVQFLHDRLVELVKTPKGVKYLVRCMSSLPEHIIEGSGLLNDIINKLPFELHAPRNWNFDTYNFCGPGTKLDKRLARGDKGVNPLDEACKEHDIWYRDHKNTEDRWAADKVLQQKAWDRVISPNADLNERAVGLVTTGGMWLKRKLGMGLGTSSYIYDY